MADSGPFADVADAIVVGAAIDWKAAESGSHDDDRPLLERYRQLAAIADLYRSIGVASLAAADDSSTRAVPADARRWGRLVLLDRLGAGAFGEVFRAWDENLDREVALKLLPVPTGRRHASGKTILEEGRVLARVRHPNVVTIYGAEVIEDRIGLWMELVDGRTLEQSTEHGSRLEPSEVVKIGIDLCGAVAAVHEAGLLHRDIKASNVMLANDGRLVLMDFGTGQKLADAGSALAGTPLYLAPELFTGGEPSRASDVYGIGVVLYRLLTGSYPVGATNLEELRAMHRRGEREPVCDALPGAPERLAGVIDRALEADPMRRYTSASELAADLSRAARSGRGARTRRFAVAAALLLAAVSWWLIGNRRDGGGGGSEDERSTAATAALLHANENQRPTLVVLPFDDSNEQPGGRHLVDGLTDEILRDLARVEGLAVRSRYSSFSFRDQPRDLQAIGRRLQADYAVTGSVARSGDHLRIQVQLVDLARDRPLWADRFDRRLESTGDLFAVVDEIARGIVNQLRLTLGAGQRRYDVDLELYERYVEARALVERRGLTDPLQAIEMLQRILADDPTFAPAYAALADAYAYQSMLTYTAKGVPPAEALEVMRDAAIRAIELDPMLAEAHAAMGVVHSRERNWREAQESFERALALDPHLTHVYTSYSFTVLRPLRRFEQARRLLEQALVNDPLSLGVEDEIAEIDFTSGRFPEAIERLERIRAVDPDLPFVTQFLGRAMIFEGRVEEGLALLDQDTASGRRSPHYRSHGLIRLGRREEVERLAAEAAAANRPYHELVMYAALGDLDRAFDALERAAATESHRLPIALTYPELQALQGDSRMAAFRQRFGLP